MFVANDSKGNRVDSIEANKGNMYFCPICGEEVELKRGEINAPHFAHLKGTCSDNWVYDMSWWHRNMQNYFPQESREVIVKHNNRRHRADVLIDNIVIEFQHSPISITEFNDRNDFFRNAGYRIAWIFDLSEQYESENIYCQEQRAMDYLMHWKHPKKIFSNIQYLSDSNKNFVLWFAYNNADSDLFLLDKVIWSPTNEYGERVMNRFMVSQYIKTIDYGFNPQELFYNKEDNFRMILREMKMRHSFNIKYKGEKGHNHNEYICERRKKFGLKLSSETGCFYCKYCCMALLKKRGNEKKWAIYCTYPIQSREECDYMHPGYECDKVDVYSI